MPAGLLDGDDLLEDVEVAAGQEGAAVDDHVDLVGAVGDGVLHVGELDRAGWPARWGRRWRRRRRGSPVPPSASRGDAGQVAVDADGGDRGAGRVGRVGTAAPWRPGERTLPGVSAPSSVVRSTIEIAVSIAQALAVVLIERVASMATRALGADLVDARQAVQEGAEGGVGAGDVRRTAAAVRSTRARHRAARRDRARGSWPAFSSPRSRSWARLPLGGVPDTVSRVQLTVVDHPLARARLSRMRDERTDNANFRAALRELTQMLMYEATRDLAARRGADQHARSPARRATGSPPRR